MKTAGLIAAYLVVGAGVVLLFTPGLLTRSMEAVGLIRRSHCGGNAAAHLKTLATAQADFRANDRDGDKIAQFWRADVAGLYALAPKGGVGIKLIERSVAAADDRPVTDLSAVGARSPLLGYWFRSIRHVDEDPKAPDPDRFAFCAFPDSLEAGKFIFVVDETNTVYRAETKGRRGIEVFPTEQELRTQWSKIDG